MKEKKTHDVRSNEVTAIMFIRGKETKRMVNNYLLCRSSSLLKGTGELNILMRPNILDDGCSAVSLHSVGGVVPGDVVVVVVVVVVC